jgi:hypothetical protein
MDNPATSDDPLQIKFVSKKSPDYRLEFINGALSNVTQRGEIVCNFHFESKDMPTEQVAILTDANSGKLSPLKDPGTFTRDIKFGIIMNASLAKDLIQVLGEKIKESEGLIAAREAEIKAKEGDKT